MRSRTAIRATAPNRSDHPPAGEPDLVIEGDERAVSRFLELFPAPAVAARYASARPSA